MYFALIALYAACIILFVRGGESENGASQEAPEDNATEEKPDYSKGNNNFVALIDIVFVDNTKRTCTGAIVHDNVVITAAHCFFGPDRLSPAEPELTASFVVIGTKKMFDSGYEQYLPIERILVHPKYEGWTADLALVFTFAAMTSAKPGSIIPLSSEKMATNLDANITVFSWGHARRTDAVSSSETDKRAKIMLRKNKEHQDSDESNNSGMERNNTTTEEENNTDVVVGFRNERVAFNKPEPIKKKTLSMENEHVMQRSKFDMIKKWFWDENDKSTEINTEKKKTSRVENKHRTQRSTVAMIGKKYWNENGESVEIDMKEKKSLRTENKRTIKRSTTGKSFRGEHGKSVELDIEKHENSGTEKKRTTKRSTVAMIGKRFLDEYGQSVELHSNTASHRFKKKKTPRKHSVDKKNLKNRANPNKHRDDKLQTDVENEMQRWNISRYLVVAASAEIVESSIRPYVFGANEPEEEYFKHITSHNLSTDMTDPTEQASTKDFFDRLLQENKLYLRQKRKNIETNKKRRPSPLFSFKSSWRRNMGATQNRLVIETFGFVNLQACRLLVDKAMPKKYNISKHKNDVVCYTNPDRCVDEKDSGAPAIRQGKLVAITVGGVEWDGDQVAVGMKISCFCSWISDNLPEGATPLSCCKNCCDVKHKEDDKERKQRLRNKNF